jgi:non-specific serine/threonine protein kinase
MRRRSVLVVVLMSTLLGAGPVTAAGPDADDGTAVGVPPAVGTQGVTVTRNNPWVALPACPHGVSRPAGAVVGDRFYVVGGEPRDGYVQEYDPVANTWDDTNALMPTPASNICAALIGTDIYIPAGYTGSYIDTLQIYHTTTDTWEVVATDPVPTALSGPACAAFGGKIYVFGGSASGTYSDATYIYDPAAAAGSRWTTGAAAPVTGAYGDAILAGGFLFYAGMRNATVDLADVHRYDPVANSWTTMPSLTTARGAARMWTYEGKLAVGGGGWSTYLTSVEEYDLSTGTGGTWAAGNALVAGSRTFAAAQDDVSGVLYAGAGWDGTFMTAAESSDYVVPVELTSFSVE